MRDATQCAPRKCQCGRRLPKPQYGYPWVNSRLTAQLGFPWRSFDSPFRDQVWFINCPCHRTYIWSYHHTSNGCWKVRSILPLFDSQEIIQIA